MHTRKQIGLFAVMLILLIANLLFWSSKKEGFHGDELYSYQFVSVVEYPSINADRIDAEYLNTWHDAEYYSDYLQISEEEAFDLSGTWEGILEDVHPPVFYIFLEFMCSLISVGSFTKWSGLLLNLIFYVLTIGILYLLAKKVVNSEWWALAVCVLYGLSVGAVNTAIFIRMYMMLTFATVFICFIHVKLWDYLFQKDSDYHLRWKWYVLLFVITVFGILTQYYFLIFAFFLCAFFWICIFAYQKYRFALEYALTMGLGVVVSILIWPDIFNDLFSGRRGVEAYANLVDSDLFDGLKGFIRVINEELFSGVWKVVLGSGYIKEILIVLILLAGVYVIKNRNGIKGIKVVDNRWLVVTHVLASLGTCLLMIAKVSPYQTDRYIFNLFPLIVLVYMFLTKKIMERLVKLKITESIVVAALVFMVLLGYKTIGVDYLFVGVDNNLTLMNEYSDAFAILVTDENRRYASGTNSIYFEKLRATYPTDKDGVCNLPIALEDYEKDKYLLFVDKWLADMDGVVEQVMDITKAQSKKYLFTTETCDVYAVSY